MKRCAFMFHCRIVAFTNRWLIRCVMNFMLSVSRSVTSHLNWVWCERFLWTECCIPVCWSMTEDLDSPSSHNHSSVFMTCTSPVACYTICVIFAVKLNKWSFPLSRPLEEITAFSPGDEELDGTEDEMTFSMEFMNGLWNSPVSLNYAF